MKDCVNVLKEMVQTLHIMNGMLWCHRTKGCVSEYFERYDWYKRWIQTVFFFSSDDVWYIVEDIYINWLFNPF